MTNQIDDSTVVRTSVDVTLAPDRAFAVFTAGIDRWWTRAHHVQSGELKEIGVDPHVGGRMWEENDAGEVCTWGRVLTWDPPTTFAHEPLQLAVDLAARCPGQFPSRHRWWCHPWTLAPYG